MTKFVLVALLGTVLMAAVVSCRGGDGPDKEKPASPASDEYARIGPQDDLGAKVGRKVVLEGRLSLTPWQHMIHWPDGYSQIAYFDYELGRQTVLYSKSQLDCPGILKVWGTVLEIKGESKRPGSNAPGVEYHILVEKIECGK